MEISSSSQTEIPLCDDGDDKQAANDCCDCSDPNLGPNQILRQERKPFNSNGDWNEHLFRPSAAVLTGLSL